MYQHHIESAQKLKEYYEGQEGVIAVVLDGSTVKGNARPDSDIDAIVVVTEERYRELAACNRLAEVIPGHCTYEGGYFDVKSLVAAIGRYPEHTVADKIACFCANLQLNRGYFLNIVPADNAYMRAHLAQEIVYSVYRLILIENRVLFPCNRRLEETVRACPKRPENILELGRAFLADVTPGKCAAFVGAFWQQSALPLTDDVSESCSQYVKYYEDWWLEEDPPFPNEW